MMKKPAASKPRAPRAAKPQKRVPQESVTPVVAPAPPPAVSEPAPTDWELAFLALYAEDAFSMAKAAGGDLIRPRPDPRLAPRWSVISTLTAVDAPIRVGRFKVGARRVFYGWLLRSAGGRLVLAIRGTQTCGEWAIDGLFAPRTAHPVAGRVESGFWSVAASMLLDGKSVASVVKVLGEPVTVVGHSLGAAAAAYVSLELARAGVKVRGVFVASPHPGDREFSKAFGAVVPDHVMYRNSADIVPKVPWWFGYCDVPNVVTLSPSKSGVTIDGGLAAQHHVLTYATLMDHSAFGAFKPLPIDRQFVDCVHL